MMKIPCVVIGVIGTYMFPFVKTHRSYTYGAAFSPSDPTLGKIAQESQSTSQEEHVCPCVHSSAVYNSQDVETARVPIGR